MPDIDNKVVSISFNNKQFLRDVEDTISVIEELNEATSGKKIDSSGIENLGRAFRNTTGDLTKQADSVVSAFSNIQSAVNTNFQTGGIDALRKALENTGMTATDVEDTITSLQQLSRTGVSYASDLGVSSTAQQIQNESANTRSVLTQDIDDVSNHFSAFEMIAMGAMIAIGEKAADIGANALRSLTSGIRDGWGEYNALTNSTQTILVNTQRWGSTMEDVSGALEELNRYADMTTYSFSDMTRNIGYFTTAGVNLEDSVTAIRGLSNVGAMFGADAQAVARAGYQISQAMSAGVIKLMDWRSMINAGMGGQALQDELIRTAAVMSGTSVDAMNEYIDSLGGFNASLQEGWLTSDIFLEAMKVFAGQSREYYRSLTDANGERLYSDEEIDRLVKLGETAMESATQVRTLQQMMDAFKESIGSGWQRTFTLIIGNLEEAKEFWTPINNILTSLVDNFFNLQNEALTLWRNLGGREELLEGIQNSLTALSNVLSAIGRGFVQAFGGSETLGARITGITEAFTDFSESLLLSEEELGFLADFFGGLFEPISLVVDVIFELIKAFFDVSDSALGLEHSADGLYDTVGRFRYALLAVLGYIGNVLKTGANFIKQSRIIRTVIQALVKVISKTFGGLVKIISAPFVALWQVWDKYNITERLDEFATKVAEFFLPLVDAISEVDNVISDWFDTFVDSISGTIKALDPIETLVQVFTSLKQLFRDLFDPTVSVSDAFSNFFNTMSTSNLAVIFEAIQSSFSDLWSALKETAIGQWFEDLGTRIQNGAAAFAETSFGQKIIEISNALRDFLGIDTSDWTLFWNATKLMLTDVADAIGTGWEKIKTFFTELVNIVKGWFGFADGEDGSVGESIDDMVGTADSSAMEDKIDVMEKTGGAIVSFMENTSKAVAMAEKLVPDPSESKFLGFIDDLPTKLTALADSVSDGTIIEKVTSFFSGLFTSISEFFSSISFDSGDDILTWLADKARVVAEIVGDFLGIQIVDLADKGVFGVIGAMLAAIFNWFGDIDMAALATIDRISKTVSRVLMGIISLKIVGTISSLANAAKAGAKGWQQQQAAKKLSALADVLKTITLFVVGIGATIFLLAYALDNDYIKPGTLFWITASAIGCVALLWLMVKSIEKNAKDIKPGSLTGIARTLANMGKLLLTSVLAIVAILGLAFVVYKIYTASNIDAEAFDFIVFVISAAFVAILASSIGIMYLLQRWAGKMNSGAEVMTSISDVLKSISGLFISIIILMTGILASVAAFTYFMYIVDQNNAMGSLLWAAGAVVAILVISGVAIAFLVKTAKKMSSGISGVKPSDFKQIMMIMSGLLVTVMASIVILIMAMTAFVSMMASTGISNKQMIIAAGVIVGLVLSVFIGLSQLFNSLKGIASLKQSGVWSSFGVIILTLLALGAFVAALLNVVANLSNTVQNIETFWSTLGGLGAIMVALIAGTAVIFKMINSMQFIDIETAKSFGVIMGSFIIITLALCAITHAMSLLVQAIGAAGLSGTEIISAGVILALMIVTIVGATYGLLQMSKIKISKKLIGVLASFAVVCGGLYVVAAGLALLSDISIGQMIAAGAVIGAITFVGVSLIAMLALLAGLLPGGIGFAALGVAAVAIIAFAGSMLALGYSLKLVSESFDIFTKALSKLASINGRKIRSNIHEIAKSIPDAMISIAGGIVAANEVIVGAGVTLGTAFATAVFTAINTFNTLIQGNIVAITTAISSILIGILESNLMALRDFVATIIKPGSELWEILTMLGDFCVEASEYLGYYGFLMVIEFFKGVIHAITDLGWDLYIQQGLNVIWTNVKNWWAENVSGWLEEKINEIVTAINISSNLDDIENIQNNLAGIDSQIAELESHGFRNRNINTGGYYNIPENDPDAQANYNQLLIERQQYQDQLDELLNQNQDIWDIYDGVNNQIDQERQGMVNANNELATMIDNAIEAERSTRHILDHAPNPADYTGYNTYIPDQYRGAGLDDRREAEEAASGLSTLGNAMKTFFGIGDGQSIGDVLKDMLGLGDIGSIFTTAGETSGLNYAAGFSGSLLNIDLSSVTNSIIPEDVLNPVITPDVDTSLVDTKFGYITDLFNNANVDQFAIDAGNSMLVREAAEGDASKNGNVTYKFTQINQSPKELPPIQIYRDTKNLLRGAINT